MKAQYNIKLNKNQKQFFSEIADHNIIVDSGTWRSGKSFQLCLFMIMRMIKYPGVKQFIGRKTLKSLKETTFLKFQEILTEHMGLIEGVDFWVNRSSGNLKIKLYTGSECVFGDLDINTIGKWLSAEYSDIGVDEAQEITKLVFEKIKSRQTQKITPHNKFIMVMNPPETANQHWTHKKFRDPETRIRGSKLIYSSVEENRENIPDHYIEEMLETVDRRTAEIYLRGLWVPMNTNIVYADYSFPEDENGNYIEGGNLLRKSYDPQLESYISMDFGWTHDMSIGWWQYDRIKNTHYRIYEFVHNHVKPENYCKLLAGENLKWNGKIYKPPFSVKGSKIIVGLEAKQKRQESDGANNYSLIEKNLRKLDIIPEIIISSPRIVGGITRVRNFILNANGNRKLFIHPDHCQRFIQDAIVYHYPTDSENNVTSEIPVDDGYSDHTQDETRYYVNHVTPLIETSIGSTQA